ncbi:hypothetical protein, partial [Kitasatospora sp. NPDC059599]|uniref:hypothetical protein n=1 Tax=Kitasatospora sp. NPDC059599 TaxID=3346880 RepID=UPI0036D0A9DC
MRGIGVAGAGVSAALAAAGSTLLCAAVWSLLALTHPGVGGVSEHYFDNGVRVAVGLTFTPAGLFLVVNRNGQALGDQRTAGAPTTP